MYYVHAAIPYRITCSRTPTWSGAAAARPPSGLPPGPGLSVPEAPFPGARGAAGATGTSGSHAGKEPRGLPAGKRGRGPSTIRSSARRRRGNPRARRQAPPLVAGLRNPMPSFGQERGEKRENELPPAQSVAAPALSRYSGPETNLPASFSLTPSAPSAPRQPGVQAPQPQPRLRSASGHAPRPNASRPAGP